MIWMWTWAVLGLLVMVAGVRRWLRLRELRRVWAETPGVDDADVRRIERTGRLDEPGEEPLDPEAIDAAEETFWAAEWEEPEEYGRD